MLKVSGIAHRIDKPIFGRVSVQKMSLLNRGKIVYVGDNTRITDIGYVATVTSANITNRYAHQSVYNISAEKLAVFHDNDVVMIQPNGDIFILWEATQKNNAFLLTTACNCNCIMCPQPPQTHSSEHLNTALRVLSLLNSDYEGEICLTGGEPTLLGDKFIEFLANCAKALPKASIVVLTNGKKFTDYKFAREVASLGLNQVMFCVSLHADVDDLHDKIVGSSGSYFKTQLGLYNLAKLGQRIEIRCVVSKLNSERLTHFAWHIYRNYPFVDHVTFMALEMTGLANVNLQEVWIDPFDYKENLENAVRCLHRANLKVSVYNHPLCLVSPWTRSFARQSISAWKNGYIAECDECSVKKSCCGLFTTSGLHISKRISML